MIESHGGGAGSGATHAQDLDARDREARERALDTTRSILLQAPAGSGKTTVLTNRFLKLLAIVDEPEQVLAITFTRKAAAEMRARVINALRSQQAPRTAHESLTHELARAVLRRSQERGWGLEQASAQLGILTIDSLNARIAAQLPIASRLGGPLRVDDDPRRAYEFAAYRALRSAAEDATLAPSVELLFERADNDWGRLESLLAEMLASRSHWLALLVQHEPGELRRRVERVLEKMTNEALQAAAALMGAAALDEATALLQTSASALRDAGKDCRWARWSTARSRLAPVADDLPYWQALASFVMVGEAGKRKAREQFNSAHGFPASNRQLFARANDWLDGIRRSARLCERLVEIETLPQPRLSDSDDRALEALSRVLRYAAAELAAEFAESGRVDHTQVAAAARQALVDDAAPTDLALRLGTRLQHILVDEFQDVSRPQFELLALLSAAWQSGDGRTMFLVGDPMQSIYMFRDAEVGLFLQVRDHGIGDLRFEFLELARNFRSAPPLVQFANRTFAAVFPETDDLRASAVKFSASVAAIPGEGGAKVEVLRMPSDDPGDALQAARIASAIRAWRTDSPHSSIAILVAARAHAAAITRALRRAGLAVAAIDLVELQDVPVVQDLCALTRALFNPADRAAWLALLRGPLCGLTLPELQALADAAAEQTLAGVVMDESRVAQILRPCAAARVGRLREALGRAATLAHRPGVAGWVEATWNTLCGPETLTNPSALDDARAFFDRLARFDVAGEWLGPEDLPRMLRGLYAAPDRDPHAVQIMTVHAAKGLEFDYVVLPSLGKSRRRDVAELLRWIELPDPGRESAAGAVDLLIAPLAPAYSQSSNPLYALITGLRQRRQAREQARLLYVAVTRARRALLLLGALRDDGVANPGPASGSALACLWPALGAQFMSSAAPRVAPAAATPAPQAGSARMLRRLPGGWHSAPPPQSPEPIALPLQSAELLAVPEFSWVGDVARHVGTVTHRALERLAAAPEQARSLAGDPHALQQWLDAQIPLWRQQLAELSVGGADRQRAVERVVLALRNTLGTDSGRWIVATRHRESHTEFGVTGLVDGRIVAAVVDRVFVTSEGERWIVDYKTGAHEGGGTAAFIASELLRYRPQLERYAALLQNLTGQKPRTGLFFPMLGEFAELR